MTDCHRHKLEIRDGTGALRGYEFYCGIRTDEVDTVFRATDDWDKTTCEDCTKNRSVLSLPTHKDASLPSSRFAWPLCKPKGALKGTLTKTWEDVTCKSCLAMRIKAEESPVHNKRNRLSTLRTMLKESDEKLKAHRRARIVVDKALERERILHLTLFDAINHLEEDISSTLPDPPHPGRGDEIPCKTEKDDNGD